jgi:hypothetical protein
VLLVLPELLLVKLYVADSVELSVEEPLLEPDSLALWLAVTERVTVLLTEVVTVTDALGVLVVLPETDADTLAVFDEEIELDTEAL